MVRLRSPAPYGGIPERPKGADCKSVVSDFGGPNPPSPTRKKHLRKQVLFSTMCSARAERDAPFGRDVDFVSDVRFAREESGTHHITLRLGAIHHYADRLTPLRRSRNFTFSFNSKVFQNFVDAFRAFRVPRQIRTDEMHFLI